MIQRTDNRMLLFALAGLSSGLLASPEQFVTPSALSTSAPATQAASVFDSAAAHYNSACAHLGNGEYDRAIAEFSEAIELLGDRRVAAAFVGRGSAHQCNGNIEQAIADYTEAIRLNPTFAAAFNNRGNAFGCQDDHNRAILDFTEAIRLDSKFAVAFLNRGIAYEKSGERIRAITDFTQALQLNPGLAEAHYCLGVVGQAEGDHREAIADFSNAIRLDPTHTLAFNNRGNEYQVMGDRDRAIADYSEAIRLDPKLAGIYANRGNAYYIKGDWDRAIADYSEAVYLDPALKEPLATQFAIAFNSRGIFYKDKGDLKPAIEAFTEAIRINPKLAAAYINRSNAYLANGDDPDLAIADSTEAMRLADEEGIGGVEQQSPIEHKVGYTYTITQIPGRVAGETPATEDVDNRKEKKISNHLVGLLDENNVPDALRASVVSKILDTIAEAKGETTTSTGHDAAIGDVWDIAIAEVAPALTQRERSEIWTEALAVAKPPVRRLGSNEIEAIRLQAKKHPWSGRPTHRYSAFEWVQKYYGQWIPGLLQHHLKFDRSSLYEAFAKRVSREGLPEWLDLPTEDEAELRNEPDPLQRARILAVRRLGRDQKRAARSIKKPLPAPKI